MDWDRPLSSFGGLTGFEGGEVVYRELNATEYVYHSIKYEKTVNFLFVDKYIVIYRGTFDGAGYTISGLYFNTNQDYVGLFGYIQNGKVL